MTINVDAQPVPNLGAVIIARARVQRETGSYAGAPSFVEAWTASVRAMGEQEARVNARRDARAQADRAIRSTLA